MVRLKALVVFRNERVGDFGDLLAIGRSEAKRILRTRENVNVKDILHASVFEAKPLVIRGGSQRCG